MTGALPPHHLSVLSTLLLAPAGFIVGTTLGTTLTDARQGAGLWSSLVTVAIAMGLQSAAARRLAVPGVPTVVLTSTLTSLVARAVVHIRHRSWGDPSPQDRTGGPAVLFGAWTAYVVGAGLGAWITHANLPLVILPPDAPVSLVALAAPTALFTGSRRGSMPEGDQPSLDYPVFMRAGLVGLAYLVALLLSYCFGGGLDQEANIWVASGVAIGVLALSDPVRWPAYIAAIGRAALIGDLLSGASWIASVVHGLQEVAVAAPTAWLLRRLLDPMPHPDDFGKVWICAGPGALGTAVGPFNRRYVNVRSGSIRCRQRRGASSSRITSPSITFPPGGRSRIRLRSSRVFHHT